MLAPVREAGCTHLGRARPIGPSKKEREYCVRIKRPTSKNEQPYVRMQQETVHCDIHTKLVKASSLTSLKIIDSCNEQPYVRTQLAIATSTKEMNECRSYWRYNLRNATLLKPFARRPYVQLSAREKRRKLNEAQISKKHSYLAIATPYVRARLAIARKNDSTKERNECRSYKLACIKIIQIIIVKNHAYLLLTTFADPS